MIRETSASREVSAGGRGNRRSGPVGAARREEDAPPPLLLLPPGAAVEAGAVAPAGTEPLARGAGVIGRLRRRDHRSAAHRWVGAACRRSGAARRSRGWGCRRAGRAGRSTAGGARQRRREYLRPRHPPGRTRSASGYRSSPGDFGRSWWPVPLRRLYPMRLQMSDQLRPPPRTTDATAPLIAPCPLPPLMAASTRLAPPPSIAPVAVRRAALMPADPPPDEAAGALPPAAAPRAPSGCATRECRTRGDRCTRGGSHRVGDTGQESGAGLGTGGHHLGNDDRRNDGRNQEPDRDDEQGKECLVEHQQIPGDRKEAGVAEELHEAIRATRAQGKSERPTDQPHGGHQIIDGDAASRAQRKEADEDRRKGVGERQEDFLEDQKQQHDALGDVAQEQERPGHDGAEERFHVTLVGILLLCFDLEPDEVALGLFAEVVLVARERRADRRRGLLEPRLPIGRESHQDRQQNQMKKNRAVAVLRHADEAGDHEHAHDRQQVVAQATDGLLEARQHLGVGRESCDDHGHNEKGVKGSDAVLLAVRGVEAVGRVVELLGPLLRGSGRRTGRRRVNHHDGSG